MLGFVRKMGIVAAGGSLILACALGGCSAMSGDHVDCNVVRLQSQSGRTDAEIASALGASISEVQKCHGAEKTGNGSANTMPSNY